MALHQIDLHPRDVLFFRDARPMAAADVGSGAHLPLPATVHDALTNHFHRLWPQVQSEWEHNHHFTAEEEERKTSARFGYLQTVGPFPARGDVVFLPTPADLAPDGKADEGAPQPTRLMAPASDLPAGNLPPPLKHSVAALARPGKGHLPPFLNAAEYGQYLAGTAPEVDRKHKHLYDAESHIGIEIDADSHGTVKGRFYSAEYLRLRDGHREGQPVCLRLWASAMYAKPGTADQTDVLARALDQADRLVLGGQQGVSYIEHATAPAPTLPRSTVPDGAIRVKWVLLTPAVWPAISSDADKDIVAHPGGWLPNWVDAASGKVMLPAPVERRPGEKRATWRERIRAAGPLGARLVAARVPKPIHFSGWSLRQHGPKSTCAAVPAGAVYYFEADSPEAARQLVDTLAWHGHDSRAIANRRSTLFGEKGFGLGVCAGWEPLELPRAKNTD